MVVYSGWIVRRKVDNTSHTRNAAKLLFGALEKKKSYRFDFRERFGDYMIYQGLAWKRRCFVLNLGLYFIEGGGLEIPKPYKKAINVYKTIIDIPEETEIFWFDGRSPIIENANKKLLVIPGINFVKGIGCFWHIDGMTFDRWLAIMDEYKVGPQKYGDRLVKDIKNGKR